MSCRIGIATLGASTGRKGGVDVYASGLIRALLSNGIKHTYTELSAYSEMGCTGKIENVTQKTVLSRVDTALWYLGGSRQIPSLSEFQMTHAIDRACRKYRLDAVHFPATRIITPQVKARVILTFFDMQYVFLPQYFRADMADAMDKSYRQSVQKAECVIAPTQFTMDSLLEKYAVHPGKITLIPAGIDDALRPATKEEIKLVREKYGLPEFYMIYPANPWPHKNHENLFKAMKMLLDENESVPCLALTGRLPGKEDILKNSISELGVAGHVRDLGFVPKRDVEVLMSGACMMVFPSLFEGFGFPVLEAMACGCAVAAANSACLPEIVGDAGLIFDPRSTESIAESIYRLAIKQEGSEELVTKGLARADAFRWSCVVPVMEDLYSRFESRS